MKKKIENHWSYFISESSGGIFNSFKDPPIIDSKSSPVKATAKADVEIAVRIRSFAEALYHDERSPFFHGFTKYHYGVMCNHMIQQEKVGISLLTNIDSGDFPTVQKWNSFSQDGTWDTDFHRRMAFNTTMEIRKYPPDSRGDIPQAHFASKEAAKTTATPTTQVPPIVNPQLQLVLEQSALANQLLMRRLVPEHAVNATAPPSNSNNAAETPDSERLQKLRRTLSECLNTKKLAGSEGDPELLSSLDARAKKCLKAISELEDEFLFNG